MAKRTDRDGLRKRKGSPYWWASYTDASGTRTRRSTGTADFKEAEALLAKWKLEVYKEKQWDEKPSHTFDELMLEYLREHENKRSIDRDRSSLKRLYPFFTEKALDTLTGLDVREYVKRRQGDGVKPATINREIGLLSAALNWARRELEWDVPNPVEGRKQKEPEGRSRWLTKAEAEALLHAAEQVARAPHLLDFIRLALNTGMRRGEMLELEWSRVDLHRSLVYLEGQHQKNGKAGSVPLNGEARAALIRRASFRAQYCPDSPWVFCDKEGQRIASVKTSFAAAVQKAGLQDVHPHDLRRTCGSWLVQAGRPIHEVSALLRHSDIRVTDRVYAHLAPENLRAAVQALEGNTAQSGHTDRREKVGNAR
ncbi:tyrosine-type recombinase/integrase [Methylococcus capsulatus]|jgi:integrase|uniref:Integrase n=1 Tax=Methylococcus capsulatus TaxID=414 RepID=A0AA35V5E9_METCP|nr:integrase [Methylococcus capsulatus]CAI8803153.1 integrase [Methylococcus capsulatus]